MKHKIRQFFGVPLRLLYQAILGAKNNAYTQNWLRPATLTWPVISVGNLSVGGAGKTPVVIELARLLRERGVHVDVLLRGYGRRSPQPVERVEADGPAQRFGDEPVLIARATGVPVYVGASRLQAGKLAEQEAGIKQGVHLLDDGFQHRKLARTVDVVVVHPGDVQDKLLPAGWLREPLSALRRADVLVLREEDAISEKVLENAGIRKPVWRVRRTLALPLIRGQAFAFCGIAHPNEFFAALQTGGVTLCGTLAFRDHHAFVQGDVQRITQRARRAEVLLTTEKDFVRLSVGQRQQLAQVAPLHTVPLKAEILDADRCMAALLRLLAEPRQMTETARNAVRR